MRSAWRQKFDELPGHGCGSVVIEAEPVDERGILLQAKDARFGITGLRFGGNRAQLSEAEPERGPRQRHLRIFIVTCG